jgi:hypothetical protein
MLSRQAPYKRLQWQRLAKHFSSNAPGRSDGWAPQRLGVFTYDPVPAHREGLKHRPGSVVTQKHTFGQEYFNSDSCRNLLKVAWEGAVGLQSKDGAFATFAKRDVGKGEIVERGILRGIAMGALDDAVSNPYVLKLGSDFLLKTGFPWGKYSGLPSPSFIASGLLMFYEKGQTRCNIEIMVKESAQEGFEFQAVAVEDIPAGAPLVRKVSADSEPEGPPRDADTNSRISEDQLQQYLQQWRRIDLERAEAAGVEPDVLHEGAVRDHVEKTNSGDVPIVSSEKTVTLPHPMWGGFGVFATQDIKAGDFVESGVMGRIHGLDGDKCPYVFTYNPDGKRYSGNQNIWGTGCGNAMFYNSDYPANVRMYRFYEHFRYLIVAKEDIKEGEEVMHLYASSSWRKCFVQDSALPKLVPVEDS